EKNGGWTEWAKKAWGFTLPGVFGGIEHSIADELAKKTREAFGLDGSSQNKTTKQEGAPGAIQGETEFNKRLNNSLTNANPLFHKSAFITGSTPASAATFGLAGIIADGT